MCTLRSGILALCLEIDNTLQDEGYMGLLALGGSLWHSSTLRSTGRLRSL